MIVLAMAAPVARRAPEYASELAQLVGDGDGRTLVEVLVDQLSDHERLKVAEVWLPCFAGGGRRDAKVELHIEGEGFKEQRFRDRRSHEERGDVLIERTTFEIRNEEGAILDPDAVVEQWQPAVPAPELERWQRIDGALLIRLAKLFVEREGATVPAAVTGGAAA